MTVPIIDLFAGPGGLGEGFSSVLDSRRQRRFKIALSIEKDAWAHQTLELRAFFREFPPGDVPDDYYKYLRKELSRDALFSKYSDMAKRAKVEAWHAELGNPDYPDNLIDKSIETALGGQRDHWVLIGGPPCQAYSLVGRARMIGGEGRKAFENDHRHFLYREYLRIIAQHRPAVFVMENVKGLLSASVGDMKMFDQIAADLKEPLSAIRARIKTPGKSLSYELFPIIAAPGDLLGHYEPSEFIVRCEDVGIPQARHRIIIVGIRSDIDGRPSGLGEAPRTSVLQAIGDLPKVRSGVSRGADSAEDWAAALHAILKMHWWTRGSRQGAVRKPLEEVLSTLDPTLTRGGEFLKWSGKPAYRPDWFVDERLKGVCNHSTRGHIKGDLQRYAFASVYASLYKKSPELSDFPRELLPAHENVEEALTGSKFNDRFRVQVRDRPATTVTSHISKDGHYYIHYDAAQCRSLTVREAARLQTFPDNYFFEGARTDQYRQVGNAVPPLLAVDIARSVSTVLS